MDEQKSTKEEAPHTAPAPKSESGNKFILIGIIVVVVIINSLIAFLLIKATKPESEEQKAEKIQDDSAKHVMERATEMGATTEEEPIDAIVNIAGTDGKRFLKASIIFEFDDIAYPELGEALVRRAPKFKNLLINHLSRQTLADLTDPDAKEKIRHDLLRLINATIPPEEGAVREVLFTTYIIQ